MKYATAVFTVVIGLSVIGVCLLELSRWRSGRTMIDRNQLGLRLGGGALLLVILGMIFFGVFFAELISDPRLFLSFWTVCMALALTLLIIAIIDLRKLAEKQKTREKELLRQFASVIRAAAAKQSGEGNVTNGAAGLATPDDSQSSCK